jgi:hypothetical protein
MMPAGTEQENTWHSGTTAGAHATGVIDRHAAPAAPGRDGVRRVVHDQGATAAGRAVGVRQADGVRPRSRVTRNAGGVPGWCPRVRGYPSRASPTR